MSSSDPNNPYANNPYGQPPAGQQPPQPGGYPSYPGQAQDPYGTPGGPPGVMPGKLNATRIMMFIAGGLQGALSLMMLIFMAAAPDEAQKAFDEQLGVEVAIGVFGVMFALYLIHAVLGIFLAAKFSKAGNGIRIGAIVWASFTIIFGIFAIPVGILWIALGVLCIVFLANRESSAWFQRNQQGYGMG